MEINSHDRQLAYREVVQYEMKSLKIMLLGLMLILIGGFIIVDPSSNLMGGEILIMLAGFLLGLIGFSR